MGVISGMLLDDETSWPSELLHLLEEHRDVITGYEQEEVAIHNEYVAPGNQTPRAFMRSNPYRAKHEQVVEQISETLQSHHLRGWHCTRLTDQEMESISTDGMRLPDRELLHNRIGRLEVDGLISRNVADKLREKNQADDEGRRARIWFCFFPPGLGGEWGIRALLEHWGGEALYNSHEADPLTGPSLRAIGRPCLVEANVAISSFGRHSFLPENIATRFAMNRGDRPHEPPDYEDSSKIPIPASQVIRCIPLGDSEFPRLTGCDAWEPKLA